MKAEKTLPLLQVFSWIIYVGICIKTGTIIISYLVSAFINPQASADLGLSLDLSSLMEFNPLYYHFMLTWVIAIWMLKASIMYQVIQIFKKLKLVQPFTEEVYSHIYKMSQLALSTGLLSYGAYTYSRWISKFGVDLSNLQEFISGRAEFLFMAAILFVISQVFKRGIEIQSESELTI